MPKLNEATALLWGSQDEMRMSAMVTEMAFPTQSAKKMAKGSGSGLDWGKE